MTNKEFNGYSFDNPKMRKHMKYVVIGTGDSWSHDAYAFKSLKDLKEYLSRGDRGDAIFKVEDITSKFL